MYMLTFDHVLQGAAAKRAVVLTLNDLFKDPIMFMSTKRGADRGFTLIELLIVVIILAILAAIVIPQFSNSTVDAKEATLDANLSALRSAIELYKVQHNGIYPGTNASTGATCTGTAGTAAVKTAQAFVDQLTTASNTAGGTCSIADTATNKYGPYIRGAIPADPISGVNAVVVSSTGSLTPPAATVTTGGYLYDTASGALMVNLGTNDSKNKAYSTH